jgi:hypothetical protein
MASRSIFGPLSLRVRPVQSTETFAAVADDAGQPRVSDDTAAARCEAAAALSDLALHHLRSRGVRRSDTDFEEQYILEIAAVSATYGLPYYDKEA